MREEKATNAARQKPLSLEIDALPQVTLRRDGPQV
jgi:hypothetical protein